MVVFLWGASNQNQTKAQTPQSPLPHTSPFLKPCNHKNPPPCIESPPVVKHWQAPEYSKEGQKANVEGTVVLEVVIGVDGLASDVRVIRGLGYGLDEEAVKALKKWTFKPATSAGKPVPSQTNIEMTFRYH